MTVDISLLTDKGKIKYLYEGIKHQYEIGELDILLGRMTKEQRTLLLKMFA